MSSINAVPDPQLGLLVTSGDNTATLAFQTNGITALNIDANQNANLASTGAVILPTGTLAQRPASAAEGMLRYNTTYVNIETYANGSWISVTPVLIPENSVAPVVSGSATVNQTLSVTTGTWTNTPTGYYYQWRANASAISNATSNTFALTITQAGANITCNVTAYNALGNSSPATSNSVGPVLNTYDVTYLSIAGGAGGGGSFCGGGGGAGGYLANTATFTPGTVYTCTVGGGGGGGGHVSRGSNGSNSSITGTGFTSVISIGGGGGGSFQNQGGPGQTGGSGGGAGNQGSSGSGTAGQGNNGGGSSANPNKGGGGGGAGGAGGSPGGGSSASSSITGSSVARAGGGGAGSDGSGGGGGGGGAGNGGGPGVNGGNASGNTGSGGGGAGGANILSGGSGGSGVIILSIPTSRYSGTQSGASVTTSGSNTILTFNSSGTYTA
jgi:hypothetical protein